MPLNILLPMVVIGIAGVVLLIRFLRPTPGLTLTDEAEARAIWNHRNPDTVAGKIRLNPTNTAALVETPSGVGLLWSFGADPVTRLFTAPPGCTETEASLIISTGDFTAPKIKIRLSEPGERHRWRNRLETPT